MKGARLFFVTLLVMATLSVQATGVVMRNPGFDEGTQGYSGHWWAPWDWYTFTEFDPTDPGSGTNLVYYWRDCYTGAAGIPTNNGFLGWGALGVGFDPTIGVARADLDHNTSPWVDTSDGYDHPRAAGVQYIKQWSACRFYTGVGQYLRGLEVGTIYEVSAYSINFSEINPPDMRLLIDPNGGNNAHAATVSSAPAPNHPRGRYWIWSSTGNNRIGNYDDAGSPDATGCYALYDKVSVQFTATSPNATLFLLVDCRNLADYDTNDFGFAWDQVSIRKVHAPVSTIAAAKAAPDGTPVTLTSVVVTDVCPYGLYKEWSLGAPAPPCFFVQDQDRSAGTLVLSGRPVSVGSVVTITGETQTYNGAVAVKASGVTVTSSVPIPKPLGITNSASGGEGVLAGKGLGSIGLRASIWGKVVEAGYTEPDYYTGFYYGYFRVDDGSNVASGAEPQRVQNRSFEIFNEMTNGFPTDWSSKRDISSDRYLAALWGSPSSGTLDPHSGRVCLGRIGGTLRAWGYQKILGLAPGERGTAKAYGWAGSDPNARVRIGVDPNGGISPTSASIVWGPLINTNGNWQELSVEFATPSGTATIFLESNHTGATGTPRTAFDDVRVYAPSNTKVGVKVVLPYDGSLPAIGSYQAVTGELWTEFADGEALPTRLLIPQDSTGIREY